MAGGRQSLIDAADCRSVPPFLSYGSKILIYYLIFLSLSAFPLISHFARRFGSVRLLISFFLPDPPPPSCHFWRQISPSVFSAFFQIHFRLQCVLFFLLDLFWVYGVVCLDLPSRVCICPVLFRSRLFPVSYSTTDKYRCHFTIHFCLL